MKLEDRDVRAIAIQHSAFRIQPRNILLISGVRLNWTVSDCKLSAEGSDLKPAHVPRPT